MSRADIKRIDWNWLSGLAQFAAFCFVIAACVVALLVLPREWRGWRHLGVNFAIGYLYSFLIGGLGMLIMPLVARRVWHLAPFIRWSVLLATLATLESAGVSNAASESIGGSISGAVSSTVGGLLGSTIGNFAGNFILPGIGSIIGFLLGGLFQQIPNPRVWVQTIIKFYYDALTTSFNAFSQATILRFKDISGGKAQQVLAEHRELEVNFIPLVCTERRKSRIGKRRRYGASVDDVHQQQFRFGVPDASSQMTFDAQRDKGSCPKVGQIRVWMCGGCPGHADRARGR